MASIPRREEAHLGTAEEGCEARLIDVGISVARIIEGAVVIPALIDGRVVPENPRGGREGVRQVEEELHLMRGVVRLVVYVELPVVELAARVVVVRGALIKKLITAVDVLDLKGVGGGPGEGRLRAFLVELFPVQAVGGGAKIAAVDVSGENAGVVACGVGGVGVVEARQGGGGIEEAVGVHIVDARAIMLSLHSGTRVGVREAQDWSAGIVEVAQQRVRRLRGVDGPVARDQVFRIPLRQASLVQHHQATAVRTPEGTIDVHAVGANG